MEGKSFAVLGIVAALSIGLVAIFVTLGFVPLAAEEPELSLLPVEESQLSPPSAEEEEFSSLLEWILSHPKGQELIDGLTKDTIDKLAVEPMPPPQEPQPVVYGDSSEHFRELTYEEAKKIWERMEPQEKPAYMRDGHVIKTLEVGNIFTGIRDLGEIDKMDAAAVEDVRNYLSKFDLSADLDGDGYISKAECIAWVESYFEERGLL